MIRSQTLLLRGLLMVSGLLLAGQTWAACTYSPRMNLGTLTVNPGLVQVAQAAAIGDVVSTTIVNIGGSYPVWIGQCDSALQRRLQHQPERHPRRIGAGLVEGLQHEYPGYRLSDTHPWRQPEYLADRHRRQHWHQLFHLCRLAEYPVRTGEDRRRRRQRSADARIRPHPGPGRSGANLTSSSCWARPASSAPPAASMRARRTSPCRSARSTAMRSRAWARRWPSETSRSGSTAMPCRRTRKHGHDDHGRDRRPIGPAWRIASGHRWADRLRAAWHTGAQCARQCRLRPGRRRGAVGPLRATPFHSPRATFKPEAPSRRATPTAWPP